MELLAKKDAEIKRLTDQIQDLEVALAEHRNRSPHRKRWINIGESPFSRAFTYKLLNHGKVASVLLLTKGLSPRPSANRR